MKLVKECVNGHRFNADNNYFSCAKCGEKLNFNLIEESPVINVDQEISNWKEGNISFSELNNRLPRMEWFSEINNDANQLRSGKQWSNEELEMLEEVFYEYGIATAEVWKEIAESVFERSVYSIEHMLRIFVQGISLEEIIGEYVE